MEFEAALPRLVSAYESGRLVPFIGAGMSRRSCPDWVTLVGKLEHEASKLTGAPPPAVQPGSRMEPTAMIQRASAAVRALKSLSPDTFITVMRDAIIDEGDEVPSQTIALARIWWPLVLTTNYDNHFASAMAERFPSRLIACVGRGPEDCQRVLNSLTTAGRAIIWALQGYLDAPRPPVGSSTGKGLEMQLVVGHEEYRRVTYRDVHFRRAFAEVFRQRSLLFLGSGIREPYLQDLFGEVLELYGPGTRPHYAFLPRGAVDPNFMAARFQISVVEYPPDDHGQVELMLRRPATAIEADSRPQVAWSWGRTADAASESWYTIPELEVIRGPLPPERQAPADWKPQPGECLAVSAGGAANFFFSSGIEEVMSQWGVAPRSQPADTPSPHLGYYPAQHVYAVRARSEADQRALSYIYEATTELLDHAARRYRRIHMQLLATGGVDKLNRQPLREWDVSPFPSRFSFVQIIRSFADWRRRGGPVDCVLTLHVVDPLVYMELASGRIDVLELLQCADLRFWAEVVMESGEIERRLFQRIPTTRLGDIAAQMNISAPHWTVEVSPPPSPDVPVLTVKERSGETLHDLGVVPGSTLHFRRAAPPAEAGQAAVH